MFWDESAGGGAGAMTWLTPGTNLTITDTTINATDTNTTYTAGGVLLDLTGTTFSINEGTLTDGNICTYVSGTGLVCNTIPASLSHDAVTLSGAYDYFTLSGQDIIRGQVDLTTDVTGTLPVGNGGTGTTTFTTNGVLYGQGASALTATTAGTSGQLLVANGSGVPTLSPCPAMLTLQQTEQQQFKGIALLWELTQQEIM